VALALAATGCGLDPDVHAQEALAAQGAPAVSVAEAEHDGEGAYVAVQRGTLRYETPAVGTFRAQQTTLVGTQVNGRVEEVLVDVGDRVQKGAVLVRIDPTFFELELEQRKADLAAVQARADSARQSIKTVQAEVSMVKSGLEDAELELQRMKSLWEKPKGETPSIPKRMYDDALFRRQQEAARLESTQSRLVEAQARAAEAASGLKQAEVGVKYARQRLEETHIRAPYDAVVTERLVDVGESVTSTPISHLLRLQQVDRLELEFSLPQNLLSRVKQGTAVDYEVEGVDAGRGRGQIAVVYPEIDEQTRAFRCKVEVGNADGRFRPGLLSRVRIADERKDVLIVPRQALEQSVSGWYVRVQGEADRRKVEVGLVTDEQAEVQSGLKEGEKVWVPTDEE
jgi:membrane fusion protein (multidrug efflux system)